MASLVIGSSVAFLVYIFNKKNPDAIPIGKLTSAQIHGHRIFSDYNRVSVPNQICDCSKRGGFISKINGNKFGSNNWLQCRCKNGKGKGSENGKGVIEGFNANTFGNASGNGNDSCYKYRKYGCSTSNKKKIDHLSLIHSAKKCDSVVGFVQNPVCDSCHPVKKSNRVVNKFYNF